jgi:hypothetical protein
MTAIPLHIQKRFEQRWASRFTQPTASNAPKNVGTTARHPPGLGNLKAEAMGEANQYCQSQGREFLLTNEMETQPPYLLGNYPRAEISFQCAPPLPPRR